MNYWCRLHIQNSELIAQQFRSFAESAIALDTCPFWNPISLSTAARISPQLLQEVAVLGTAIREVALLVMMSDCSTLHIDHTTGLNAGVKARLNIPVLNTEGTTTAFYEMSARQMAESRVNANGTRFWNSREGFVPVTSVDVTEPTVLRTSAPHTVWCHSGKFPRLMLTLSFKRDAVFWLNGALS